ncbi:MAG: acylphosphatase [Ignavibacteria bacterium RBG_16_34_14]|nr:MAG: acylphosphatase [Ignavibacteria bacterium RBG_16_34_14]
MDKDLIRAEIVINGLVQGVGFRYYIYRNAVGLGLKGFTENLFSGEVLTVVEGSKPNVEELYKRIIVGPSHASVRKHNIIWQESKNEFEKFEVRN